MMIYENLKLKSITQPRLLIFLYFPLLLTKANYFTNYDQEINLC